ncbi:hypothetical protein QWY86_04750 [Pedobacter aquatilis]|uniref:hypothetical protein n=1 Tax=Pedobacter aquatilis TaxID=351343 RepID=UPI0025B58F3A|nr:hypothetical protein [Pedobacter aquatilis]MDN3585964.1 hypothetical protein [Pedobacter aquatilis]
MNKLKAIAYNCKQATFLIEKKQLATLTVREKLELKIHLTGCAVCKLYEQQSIFITRLTKHIFNNKANRSYKLTDDFKETLQKNIEKELDKK